MRRAFMPAAVLALLLFLCLDVRTFALTLEPVIHVNTAPRPRIGAVR